MANQNSFKTVPLDAQDVSMLKALNSREYYFPKWLWAVCATAMVVCLILALITGTEIEYYPRGFFYVLLYCLPFLLLSAVWLILRTRKYVMDLRKGVKTEETGKVVGRVIDHENGQKPQHYLKLENGKEIPVIKDVYDSVGEADVVKIYRAKHSKIILGVEVAGA